jgi:putative spermidine/putrescine transport system permease protein
MIGGSNRIALLAVPGLAFLAVVYALPLALLLFKSLQGANGLTLVTYIDFFSDEFNRVVLWRTLRVALLTTLLALVIAYPTAFAMARAKGIWLTVFLVALVLPMSLGVIVKAFAWSILFRSNGFINTSLQALGITDEPVRMLFTETALIIGAADILGNPAARQQPARGCIVTGSNTLVPLHPGDLAAQPARCRGGVGLYVLTCYFDVCDPVPDCRRAPANPVDADRKIVLLPARRATRVDDFGNIIGDCNFRRAVFKLACRPSGSPPMTPIDRIAIFGAWLIGIACILFLMLPIAITVATSFTSSAVYTLPPPEWSLRWYRSLERRSGLWDAVQLSLNLALISTAVSMVLGTMAAIAVARGDFRGREAVATFTVSPLMMPGLVVGVALLQFFREIGLRDAYWSLLLAHVVITLPFVMRTLLASMGAFDFSLIDAARTLGLSYPRAILKVLIPNLAPAYLTGGLFAFLASMDNYPISIFLTDARNKTLPIKMLQYLEEQPDPSLAAMSSGLIMLAVVVLVIASRTVGLHRMIDS